MSVTVFVHGAGGSAKHWFPLLAELNAEISPLLYELPGHGDRKNNVAPTIPTTVTDFADFIEKNKLDQFNLIAHSLGGLIAMQYALDFPERIYKLILISTAARILMHPDFMKQIYSRIFDFEFLVAGFTGNITEEAKQQVICDLSRLNFSEQSDDFMGVTQCNLTNKIHQINIPTLILIGESDRIVSPRRSRELSKKIPSAKLVVIPNAAHYPHLENIKITANTINEFVGNIYEKKPMCMLLKLLR